MNDFFNFFMIFGFGCFTFLNPQETTKIERTVTPPARKIKKVWFGWKLVPTFLHNCINHFFHHCKRREHLCWRKLFKSKIFNCFASEHWHPGKAGNANHICRSCFAKSQFSKLQAWISHQWLNRQLFSWGRLFDRTIMDLILKVQKGKKCMLYWVHFDVQHLN